MWDSNPRPPGRGIDLKSTALDHSANLAEVRTYYIFFESILKMKQVRFNSCDTIIHEPLHIADALYESRKSDQFQQKADKMRMERLLSPILSSQHREYIYRERFSKDVSLLLTINKSTYQVCNKNLE